MMSFDLTFLRKQDYTLTNLGVLNQVNFGMTRNTCQVSETEDLVVSVEGEVRNLTNNVQRKEVLKL